MRATLVALVLVAACSPEPTEHLPAPKPAPASSAEFNPPATFTKLRLSLAPYTTPEELKAAHGPFAAWLSMKLKVPVELVITENYDDAAAKLEKGEVDLVEMSAYAYVRAQKWLKLKPLVTAIADGSETASGYIVVRQDSPIHTLEDLKGAAFGFVDPASASGYLYPLKLLKDRGLDPKTFFASTQFMGNHENVLMAIYEGAIDAGATYQGSLPALRRSKKIDPLNFRIIAKTPRTPRDLYCVRADFPPEIAQALTSLLLGLSSREPKGREVLTPLNLNGFFPFDDHLYDGVRTVAAQVDAQ